MGSDPGEKPKPDRVGQRFEHAGHALGLGGRQFRCAKRWARKLKGSLRDELRWNRHAPNNRVQHRRLATGLTIT
jgi:hypothetical protein